MEEYKDYEDDEREISMRLMFYHGLKNWRKLLLAGAILTIIFAGAKAVGGYKAAAAQKTSKDSAVTSSSMETTGDELADPGTAALNQYQASKDSLDYTLQSLLDKVDENTRYKEDSILMNLNPYDLHKDTLVYYIQTDKEITADSISSSDSTDSKESWSGVANAYLSLLEADTLANYTGTDAKLDAKYLKELILSNADKTGSVLTIKVVGDSADLVRDLAEYVKQNMNDWKESVTTAAGEHNLQLLQENPKGTSDTGTEEPVNVETAAGTVSVSSDLSVASLQDAFNSSMNDIQSQLNNLRAFQSNLQKPDSGTADGAAFSAKDIVKFGGIGFAVGFFLLLFWYFLAYIFSGKLREGEKIKEQYGIDKLTEFQHPAPGQAKLDLFLREHMGPVGGEKSKENMYSLAAAAIELRMSNSENSTGKILIVSSLDDTVLQNAAGNIRKKLKKIHVEKCGSVLHNPEILHTMQEVKDVLVVEEAGKTKVNDMKNEIEIIRRNNCSIVGSVII